MDLWRADSPWVWAPSDETTLSDASTEIRTDWTRDNETVQSEDPVERLLTMAAAVVQLTP